MKKILKKALLLLPCIILLTTLQPKRKAVEAAIIIEDPSEYYRTICNIEGIEITTTINEEDYSLFYDFTPLFAGYQNTPQNNPSYYTFVANNIGINTPNEYRITTKIEQYTSGSYKGDKVYFISLLLDLNFSGANENSKYKIHMNDFFYNYNYKNKITWYGQSPYVKPENVDTISIYNSNDQNPNNLQPLNIRYEYSYNYINQKNQSNYIKQKQENNQYFLNSVDTARLINYDFMQRGQLQQDKDTIYITDGIVEFTIENNNNQNNGKAVYLNLVMIDKNYTYSINNFMYDNGINSTDIGEIQNIFTSLAMGVSNILEIELFPNFSFSSILLMILTVTFIMLLLKFFAGG